MELAKRESILKAASRAFAKLGFKKASIDEIARDAGVAKGTVYLACESKEDLFYQAVHRELRAWLAEVAKQIDHRVPADELITRIAQAGFVLLEERTLVRDLFSGIYHGQLPGWAARFDELKELGHANITEILKLGVKQGRFRSELDVEATARVLQDLNLSGYIFHARSKDNLDQLRRRFQAGMDLVLKGLLAR